ncbi:MAG: hypothetical protein LBS63_02195 [Prevotellaceae bacterium]|jgi:hypothetical protein|nr:hypothetical protein [Prevotellaceae bacterium]
MDTMVLERPKARKKVYGSMKQPAARRQTPGQAVATDDDNLDIVDQIHAQHPEWELPCRMTVAELRAEVEQSVLDVQNGLVVSMEEMRARHPRI